MEKGRFGVDPIEKKIAGSRVPCDAELPNGRSIDTTNTRMDFLPMIPRHHSFPSLNMCGGGCNRVLSFFFPASFL